ncbi:ribosome-associated complex protein SSZ1 [Ascoidea rubescens DSM 1968]|uniref:Actin-like ATPase domain-containing protein n=1 Tax=Ascoidea rubescens DSM 1968 TaxID=1344418 RepID=A0A1D2VFL7_9ASCO|nr:actin-like ATPase domain-containing protein [Ascoidea rubescens DSM 1968]ODV60425.1 actin-like ATPase domain-containing protein [Ascoidea rubescens DSM 1968]
MSVIGIAFGNSTSSIAVSTAEGKVEVIANPDGERAIPSALSYVAGDEYHGGQAIAQLISNPKNTITNFRDFIGVSFEKIDPTVCESSSKPINLDGKVGFRISKNGQEEETLSIDEVVTRHLRALKLAAEDYIGEEVEGVVMTIPTNFTEQQKAALKAASKKAGLDILQFINEPSAALLAHVSANDSLKEDKLYVVGDFGNIRSDAAVIAVRGGIMTILATSHDELGGEKLDAALMEFFSKEFEKKYKVNPRKTTKSLAKLKDACATAKKTLSNVQTATISIDALAEGFDLNSSINRLRFELVGRNVFSQMTTFIESVVKKAGYDRLYIDEVLLVGGTSFAPKLAANLEAVFPETTKIISPATAKAIDPTQLIARGAALQASMVESFDESEINESLQPIVLNTLHLPNSVGILDSKDIFHPILLAETAVPIRKSLKLKVGKKGNYSINIVEANSHIKETTVEAAAKEEKPKDQEDDDESDWSDEDDEPEILRERVYVTKKKLVEIAFNTSDDNSTIEVTLNVVKDGKLQVFVREDKIASIPVKAEVLAQ